MRRYSRVDMLRFKRLADENKDLLPLDLLKLYNEKYPEKSDEEKMANLLKIMNLEPNKIKMKDGKYR